MSSSQETSSRFLSWSTQPITLNAAIIALFHAFLAAQLWTGDFFNSYAYMSDDSFDWVTQGVALNQLISGVDGSDWPVLRQPVFVFIAALDDILGSHGIAFLFAQLLAVFVTCYALGEFARKKGFSIWVSILVPLAWYFSIIGFYKFWILSDTLASSFMTLSVVLLLERLEKLNDTTNAAVLTFQEKFKILLPALCVSALAGLTQTYGLIPFLVIPTVYIASYFLKWTSKSTAIFAGLAMISATLLVFGGKAVWSAIIPHASEPKQFVLLEVGLGMASFYSSVWPLAFGTFLPAILVGIYARFKSKLWIPSVEQLALLGLMSAFATMTFIYQWTESRLTYMYLPLVWLTLLAWNSKVVSYMTPSLTRLSERVLLVASTATIAVGLIIHPGDYWKPDLAKTRLAPSQNWILSTFTAQPLDRFHLQTMCEGMSDVCEKAEYLPQASPYRTMMFEEYKRRTLLEEE